MFTLRRGDLLLAVNFGSAPATLPESGDLLFTTPTTASVGADGLRLPAHAGVLLRAVTRIGTCENRSWLTAVGCHAP